MSYNIPYLAALITDGYKVFHPFAYRPGTTHVYSNGTARFNKHSNVPNNAEIVHFGIQMALQKLNTLWNENFFKHPKEAVLAEYQRVISGYLGKKISVDHIAKLHDVGYLPIEVKSLPEGSLVPYGVPPYTIHNTVEGLGWVTNLLETPFSAEYWPAVTSATTAFAYRSRFEQVPALRAGGMIKFMGHDFSARGLWGMFAPEQNGHLTSFVGTDSMVSGLAMEQYYDARIDKELVMASVDATEHSVMCSYETENELESLIHLISNVTPNGIISIVSDTWDFWQLVTQYLPEIKDLIMSRDGTVVIRPDSGDPVKILTGYTVIEVTNEERTLAAAKAYAYNKGYEAVLFNGEYHNVSLRENSKLEQHEVKGLIECLWDTFGGTEVDGLRLLDSHIGAIYGDSITLERQDQIIERLLAKGFVPSVVLGIGSFTYQYVTRDTHGFAIKATDIQVGEGNHIAISKDPKTDQSKKSAKGLLMVVEDGDSYRLVADVTPEQEASEENCLKTIFKDGEFVKRTSLAEIRARIDSHFE
ncbi:nicotinate phosphoribosyltransferase [Vibrio phage Direpillow8]|uniref:Nicotinamide phosphoribosyltransferase n=1 Tax=Vibrio phage Bennett TaxID=2735171 RepID=A0A6M4ESC8_9CAUD|nr:nicotinamide phosphoribosyl transferase [Vibrio phage Bennett]QKE61014.1 nicotinate phosphoribosyltransferase [Vibrio phage Dax]QKN84623.1 nicotinate phosphoribosyltransferase [Vibrio phage BBMuffin]QKN85596.1 nicotinate phosphoribosyltransferase [Vibrio phage Direpillow8]WBU76963.1 nicotinate phosphoribosyltransferase [Vibrio phage Kronos]QJQ85191.1 nicotinate phosphoribosyltransferase [Vibrio phage Bennett]